MRNEEKLYRCLDDGKLVRESNLEPHAGHRIKEPAVPNLWERFLLFLGLI